MNYSLRLTVVRYLWLNRNILIFQCINFFFFTAENNDHSSLKRCFALLLRCVSRVCCMYVCVCVWSASYCNLHRHHHDLCCAGEQDRFEVLKSLLYKGHTDTEVNNNHDALKCHISTHTHMHSQSHGRSLLTTGHTLWLQCHWRFAFFSFWGSSVFPWKSSIDELQPADL